jgi:hypothetical protein
VFQGRIVVEPGADQTDARMGHHALILSDKAEVDAKPELLIFADDVSVRPRQHHRRPGRKRDLLRQQRGIPERGPGHADPGLPRSRWSSGSTRAGAREVVRRLGHGWTERL